MVPASAPYMPNKMFMSVVLPAPFSPNRPSTSPRNNCRSMDLFACTPPKCLSMPRISSSGRGESVMLVFARPGLESQIDSKPESPNLPDRIKAPHAGRLELTQVLATRTWARFRRSERGKFRPISLLCAWQPNPLSRSGACYPTYDRAREKTRLYPCRRIVRSPGM